METAAVGPKMTTAERKKPPVTPSECVNVPVRTASPQDLPPSGAMRRWRPPGLLLRLPMAACWLAVTLGQQMGTKFVCDNHVYANDDRKRDTTHPDVSILAEPV